ncbi:MAG: hypothetical protein RL653_1186 [Pseudomonadota bacterium]|jgi:hypothetical protein
MEGRVYVDCREVPPDARNCSLRMSGTEQEVVRAAVQHSVDVPGAVTDPGLESTVRAQPKREEGGGRAAGAGQPGGAGLHGGRGFCCGAARWWP